MSGVFKMVRCYLIAMTLHRSMFVTLIYGTVLWICGNVTDLSQYLIEKSQCSERGVNILAGRMRSCMLIIAFNYCLIKKNANFL